MNKGKICSEKYDFAWPHQLIIRNRVPGVPSAYRFSHLKYNNLQSTSIDRHKLTRGIKSRSSEC
jgi:hypothetical protein